MKKLLLILLCLPMIGFGQKTYVPDDNFENYLEANGMGDGITNNDSVLTSNINTIYFLNVANMNIADLTGIEDFIFLEELTCYNNQLTILDVSNNTNLEELYCDNNQLTNLDLYQNHNLIILYCYNNQLASLDLSQNTNLTHLRCESNQLTSLNLRNTNNINMSLPGIYFNLSNNPQLYCIDVDDTTWATANWTVVNGNIDSQHYFSVSCGGAKTYVPDDVFENFLESNGMGDGIFLNDSVLTVAIDSVSMLDISSPFPFPDIYDLTGVEAFTDLQVLYCGGNQLTSLDVSQNTALTYLSCNYNQLTSLDVSQNTALTTLYCSSNQLTSLDVSNNTALKNLNCAKSQLINLDVSQNTNLTLLNCSENNLLSLNVSGAIALDSLYCYDNQLTILDLSNNPNLTRLWCFENYLTNLFVSGATALTHLYCSYNQLTSLDISNNTALTFLECVNNLLISLDVGGATALNFLYCYYNQLTTLDVSQNTALEIFNCQSNQLTSLDVSQNINLKSLDCRDNQLTSLDLRNGNNTNLIVFNSLNNPNLFCIDVDDSTWATNNWTWMGAFPNIDYQHYFSNNCLSTTDLQEHTTNKELLKITDLLGRETKQTNQPLFYLYDDGTVEKRIVIE